MNPDTLATIPEDVRNELIEQGPIVLDPSIPVGEIVEMRRMQLAQFVQERRARRKRERQNRKAGKR